MESVILSVFVSVCLNVATEEGCHYGRNSTCSNGTCVNRYLLLGLENKASHQKVSCNKEQIT